MHRMLQGEVGSGKTIVSVLAMLQMVDAGYQCALLAPTEVLAAQHARSIRDVLGPLGMAGELGGADGATRVALLTGSMTAQQKRQVRDEVAGGEAGIVIGTHAILQDAVDFHSWAWWSSTSSTDSVWSNGIGCAPRLPVASPRICW